MSCSMRRLLILSMVFAMAGCSNAATNAEKEYEMVSKRGSQDEICAAATKVADAWLSEQNTKKYDYWVMTRDIDCLSAKTHRDVFGY